MTPSTVMDLAFEGMKITLLLATPLLGTALFMGLTVALFQAATQINEMTLSFIPKILAVFGLLIVLGPWLLGSITDFTRALFLNIPNLVN